MRLSVVIPAYNEAGRICDTIENLLEYFSGESYGVEIVAVDDGSEDGTAGRVRDAFSHVKVISYPVNRGKGYAVRQGLEAARGEYRLVYDADGSTPIEELAKVWPKLEAGAEIVIGSRALDDSEIVVRQPFYRESMGRTYNLILKALALTRFPDTQCGFKVFSEKSCNIILPRLTLDGFGSDCEMLCVARVHGLGVDQIPVRWINSPDTRVHVVFDSLDMLREILILRFRLLRGLYA